MKKRPRRSYDIFLLGILTVLAAGTWIVMQVYRNATKKPDVSPVTSYYTRALSPNLDSAVLDDLSKRLVLSESQVPTPLPTVQATASASPSGGL